MKIIDGPHFQQGTLFPSEVDMNLVAQAMLDELDQLFKKHGVHAAAVLYSLASTEDMEPRFHGGLASTGCATCLGHFLGDSILSHSNIARVVQHAVAHANDEIEKGRVAEAFATLDPTKEPKQ